MPLQREKTDWLVRAGRRTVSLVGTLGWVDGSTASVLVSEISYQGCRISSDHHLDLGETVTLDLPALGMIKGQVRWTGEGQAGIRFLTGDSAVASRRARLGI